MRIVSSSFILDREYKFDAPAAPPEIEPLTYLERMRRRALEDERNGKCVVMGAPNIKRRLPRKPSWDWGW